MVSKQTTLTCTALFGILSLTNLLASAADKHDRPKPSAMVEERRIEMAVRDAERRELVRPAPQDFKPEAEDRKLRLSLIPRDKTVRVGERFWYRIELQNVGRQPVRYWEPTSFLKDGARTASGRWNFDMVDPEGKRIELVIGTLFGELAVKDENLDAEPIPGSEKMSDAEVRDYIRRDAARRRADRDLEVILAPGEVLTSRPWRWHDVFERQKRKKRGEPDLTPRPQGPWRELWVSYPFKKPGSYSITVVYDDSGPSAPDEDFLRAMEKRGFNRASVIADHQETVKKRLGRLSSQPVHFEVGK